MKRAIPNTTSTYQLCRERSSVDVWPSLTGGSRSSLVGPVLTRTTTHKSSASIRRVPNATSDRDPGRVCSQDGLVDPVRSVAMSAYIDRFEHFLFGRRAERRGGSGRSVYYKSGYTNLTSASLIRRWREDAMIWSIRFKRMRGSQKSSTSNDSPGADRTRIAEP